MTTIDRGHLFDLAAELQRKGDLRSANMIRDALYAWAKAEDRATRAEAERDEWRQTALDERGAALDALEQVKVRDRRIQAVREPHQKDGHDPDECGEPDCFASCIEDGMEWPCDTIRALDQ